MRLEDDDRWLRPATWGFRGTKGQPLINAKSETVRHMPAFRDAFRERRCIMPADGFFEWRRLDGEKQPDPMWFHCPDGGLLFMAGIWQPPTEPGKPPMFVVLTTKPNAVVSAVHDRMPVLLNTAGVEAWLRHGDSGLLVPAPDDLPIGRWDSRGEPTTPGTTTLAASGRLR